MKTCCLHPSEVRRCFAAYFPQRVRGDHELNKESLNVAKTHPAAVLVPLFEKSDHSMNVVFIRRSANLRTHAGQVSFPGGQIEKSDINPMEAALRETREEIGLHANNVEIIGQLDPYVTRTRFYVTPVVGLIHNQPHLKRHPEEVEEIFEMPLSYLFFPDTIEYTSRQIDNTLRRYYALFYNQWYIWGATAGMLVNLKEILEFSCYEFS